MELDDVLIRCRNARFTGVLRVRSREADGEIWLLSGIVDVVRFGADVGDVARQRMCSATNVAFEFVTRLPGLTGGFKTRLDVDGPLGTATPVALMRHCEVHAITCELDLVFGNATVRASYADGELRSIESSSPSASVATLLESREGRYRFVLPPPPEGIPVRDPGKSVSLLPAKEEASDSPGMRALSESRRATRIEPSVRPGDDAEIEHKAVDLAARRNADAEAEAQRRAAAEIEAKRRASEQAAVAAERRADEDAEAKRKAAADDPPEPLQVPGPVPESNVPIGLVAPKPKSLPAPAPEVAREPSLSPPASVPRRGRAARITLLLLLALTAGGGGYVYRARLRALVSRHLGRGTGVSATPVAIASSTPNASPSAAPLPSAVADAPPATVATTPSALTSPNPDADAGARAPSTADAGVDARAPAAHTLAHPKPTTRPHS